MFSIFAVCVCWGVLFRRAHGIFPDEERIVQSSLLGGQAKSLRFSMILIL